MVTMGMIGFCALMGLAQEPDSDFIVTLRDDHLLLEYRTDELSSAVEFFEALPAVEHVLLSVSPATRSGQLRDYEAAARAAGLPRVVVQQGEESGFDPTRVMIQVRIPSPMALEEMSAWLEAVSVCNLHVPHDAASGDVFQVEALLVRLGVARVAVESVR